MSRNEIVERITTNDPPQDMEAERAVIGACLRDPEQIDAVRDIVRPIDFYNFAHKRFYEILLAMAEAGTQAIDLVTFSAALSNGKVDDDVTGMYELLAGMYNNTPTSVNAVYYANIVRFHANRRHLMHAATAVYRLAEEAADPDCLLDDAEREIFTVRQEAPSETRQLRHYLYEVSDAVDRVAQGEVTGFSTGFWQLDPYIKLGKGEFWVIAARPSAGKSLMGMQMALSLSLKELVASAIYSPEMRGREIAARALANYASIEADYLQGKRLAREGEGERMARAILDLSAQNIFINQAPYQTANSIVADARRMKRRHQIGAVFVDYLQLVEGDDQRASRFEQLSKISRTMKTLGGDVDAAVIAMAQLNREVKPGEVPQMHHIRECGNIEQDADGILLLWPDINEHTGEPSGRVNCKIAKNRNGPRDVVVQFVHTKHFIRFDEPLPA